MSASGRVARVLGVAGIDHFRPFLGCSGNIRSKHERSFAGGKADYQECAPIAAIRPKLWQF
jgi:hypothetical protein